MTDADKITPVSKEDILSAVERVVKDLGLDEVDVDDAVGIMGVALQAGMFVVIAKANFQVGNLGEATEWLNMAANELELFAGLLKHGQDSIAEQTPTPKGQA